MSKKAFNEAQSWSLQAARNGVMRWKKMFRKKSYYVKREKIISLFYSMEKDDLSNMINTTKKVLANNK